MRLTGTPLRLQLQEVHRKTQVAEPESALQSARAPQDLLQTAWSQTLILQLRVTADLNVA